MIDFHSHILPKMDDGSRSTEESVSMLKALSEQGVTKVIATPHFYANDESVSSFVSRRQNSYGRLSEASASDMPEIVLGAEVRYYGGIGHLDALESLCIQGSRLLLLEMPENRWTEYTVREICDIRSERNIIPVLAHIERYIGYQKPETFYRLLENGVMMQINAGFVNGTFSRRKSLKLLKKNQVHFIGSDCHNMSDRAPDIEKAVNIIRKKLGNGFADAFTDFAEVFLKI